MCDSILCTFCSVLYSMCLMIICQSPSPIASTFVSFFSLSPFFNHVAPYFNSFAFSSHLNQRSYLLQFLPPIHQVAIFPPDLVIASLIKVTARNGRIVQILQSIGHVYCYSGCYLVIVIRPYVFENTICIHFCLIIILLRPSNQQMYVSLTANKRQQAALWIG